MSADSYPGMKPIKQTHTHIQIWVTDDESNESLIVQDLYQPMKSIHFSSVSRVIENELVKGAKGIKIIVQKPIPTNNHQEELNDK